MTHTAVSKDRDNTSACRDKFFSPMSREMPWSLFTAKSEMYISINNVSIKGHTQDIIPLIHASALQDVTPNLFVQYLLHVFSFTWQAVIAEIESLHGIFQDNKMTAISIFDRQTSCGQ